MTHEDTASICLAVGASSFGIDLEYSCKRTERPAESALQSSHERGWGKQRLMIQKDFSTPTCMKYGG